MVGKAERCNLVEKAGITKFLYLFAINHQSSVTPSIDSLSVFKPSVALCSVRDNCEKGLRGKGFVISSCWP